MALQDPEARIVDEDMRRSTPVVKFQYLDVTFGSADTDLDIAHDLRPSNPERINYQVVRADRATSLYHDTSATRRPWGRGYVVLRSSAADAQIRLLLTVERV